MDDLNRAPEIGKSIEQAAGPGYMTTNWMEQNRELFRALRLEQVVTFIVIGLIVIVAALNILIALTMMVMEKTRDIAVLMSFGVEPAQVRNIFLMQGFLISVIGTVLGLVLGYVASWIGAHYHFIHLSAEVYSIDTLPFAPRVMDGVIVSAVSIGVSLLATLYPSLAAARDSAGRGAAVRVGIWAPLHTTPVLSSGSLRHRISGPAAPHRGMGCPARSSLRSCRPASSR